jgi:Nickel responsive protein SCO4226-like
VHPGEAVPPPANTGRAAPLPAVPADHQHHQRQEHDMARFIDFHEDLKLPAQAIAQIADDTRNAKTDQFGVRQIELYHNPDGRVYCLLEGPDEEAIRAHHAALGVPCGDVHQVNSLT